MDLPNFLSGLISSVNGVASEKRIEVRAEFDDSLGKFTVDPEKMEKVILNLLFNSLKFTMPGGEVTVRGYVKDSGLVSKLRTPGSASVGRTCRICFIEWQGALGLTGGVFRVRMNGESGFGLSMLVGISTSPELRVPLILIRSV